MTPVLPSGRQFVIRHGDDVATVVELGGGLRSYIAAGRELLDGFAANEAVSNGRGQVLAPWPNRIDGGRYTWDGNEHQLALTEPARSNAIHGLLRFVPWNCARHDASEVAMSQQVLPQPGYPFALTVEVAYRLSDSGLEVTTTARNTGTADLPWALGHHPYLAPPGAEYIDECSIELRAATYVASDERGIPTDTVSATDTAFDLRAASSVRDLQLDTAFTDLERDDDGHAHVQLVGPNGIGTELWMDASYPYAQLFSGDTLAPDRRRRGLAVEPMTAPANAFRSGTDVIRLEPGAATSHQWGIRALTGG